MSAPACCPCLLPLPCCPRLLLQDLTLLRSLVQRHVKYTNSTVGRAILLDWEAASRNFVKVGSRLGDLLDFEENIFQRQWCAVWFGAAVAAT